MLLLFLFVPVLSNPSTQLAVRSFTRQSENKHIPIKDGFHAGVDRELINRVSHHFALHRAPFNTDRCGKHVLSSTKCVSLKSIDKLKQKQPQIPLLKDNSKFDYRTTVSNYVKRICFVLKKLPPASKGDTFCFHFKTPRNQLQDVRKAD